MISGVGSYSRPAPTSGVVARLGRHAGAGGVKGAGWGRVSQGVQQRGGARSANRDGWA